jgi:hypothetical protein
MTENVSAAALDLGTMFLQGMRDSVDGKGIVSTQVRDCYREVPFVEEFEDQLKQQQCQYIKEGDKIYVLGDQAYIQAGMAEISSELKATGEILKRPMKDGILNPDSPKVSLSILRALMKACVEKDVGPAREGEILYFSVPANPTDSTINNLFHSKMAEKYLNGLGFDARPIGEGLAVVFGENPKMHSPEGDIPFTGFGLSFGAGMVNFCLAERGVPLDEFSVARSGDWIDNQVARMTGQPKTKVLRVKEKKLNFNTIDNLDPSDESYDVLLALECYYEDLINYVFSSFAKRFGSTKGSIEHPIDVVLAGGTACPPGFDKKVKKILSRMNFPFEISEVRLAGGGDQKKMLQSVAKGCYIRAKQAAKKMTAAKDVLDQL